LAPRAKAWLIGGAAGAAAIAVLCITLFSRPKVAAGTQALALSRGVPEETNYVEIVLTPSPTPVPTPTPTPDPTLKRGIEGEPVQQLQERLMQLGYLDLDESTQLYGPATAAAVRLFQRQVAFTETLGTAITEDGVAGEQTLHLIYSDTAPKYIVKEGMRGDDVTNMQKQLKDMGYMSETTGYYGEKTIAAIKDFQRRNGLSADGLAGTYTYELLYSPNAKESASKVQAARTKASVSKMIEIAKSKMGSTYILGKTGPSSFDCSGLVYYCLKQAGSNRRRLSAAGYSQVSDWEKISSINSLKKGDLIFFYNDGFSKVGHVGIVVSSGMMIDASSANGKVVKRSFSTTYWKKHFVCGRRPW
jgi:cell wall-associated NlpC family hydrolase